MQPPFDRASEDTGNIVHLEHVNVRQPDQTLATLFYVSGLGFTRDPYIMVGVDNMWINIGRSQMHLPTGEPQRLRGTIGLVVPSVRDLLQRLDGVRSRLAQTQFQFTEGADAVEVTCPWGNRFRCHAPEPQFGNTELAMPYVELRVPAGSTQPIARFYREIMGAAVTVGSRRGTATATVSAGNQQFLYFMEADGPLENYDGHHVQIYIADFSKPHRRLLDRGLITRETSAHEWRFRDIVDSERNRVVFTIEHEVRSLKHPLYGRPLVNRNPAQSNVNYMRGQDAFRGTY